MQRKHSKLKSRTLGPNFYPSMDAWFVESHVFLPVFGRSRMRLANGEENGQAAEREFQKIMRLVESQHLGDDRRIDALAEEHLQWFKGELDRGKIKERRLKIKAAHLRDFCGCYGKRTVSEFQNGAGYNMFDEWLSAHKEWTSPSTRETAFKSVASMFNWAARRSLISQSPAKGYEVESGLTRADIVFTAAQEQAIYDEIDDIRLLEFVQALFHTGGRTYVEVASVLIENIRWDDKNRPATWELGIVKGKPRTIYLDDFMKDLTARLSQRHRDGHLFRNRRDTPLRSATAGQRFAGIIRTLMAKRPELGLTERHTPYGCRHTWITRALDNEDFTIQDVAEMAGTSVQQIERTYKTVGRRHRKLSELADKVHRNSKNIE